MTGRRNNNNNANRFGNQKKPALQNQNRNRLSGGKPNNYSGGGLINQVSPWLSQSNNGGSSFNSLGRNIVNDPQAQLALASNLLNNLLSPSHLNKLSSQPPSLLSLGNMSNAGSSYGGNQSYNRDRFGAGRANPGKVQKRDDYKKHDFKNKRFGNDRKNVGLKKPDQSNKKSTGDEKKDTTIGTATTSSITTSNVTDTKEEVKVDNTDKLDQSVSVNEAKKEEKVVGHDKKSEAVKKDDDLKPEEVKVSYSEIPPGLLYCHICRKHMWDDTSFEKHLEGRPHKMMVEELDQSYKLKVDLLRHEMRVTEQQRENDIQRAQRKGKSNVKSQQRGFCTMCNLSFLGMLPAHRKNEKHQKLKKFLHPKCSVCSKEFYTRLEWDDHKLTPSHLQRLAEIRKAQRPDLQDTEFDIADFIEDVNDEIEAEGADIKVVGKRETMEELQIEQKDGGEETGGNASALNLDGEGDENCDENDKDGKGDEDEETKKLPKYSPGIPVGETFVIERTGHLCRPCNRFMLAQEDIKIHCQTIVHYNNIIKILKAQNKIVRKRKMNESSTKVDNEEKTTDGKTATVGNDDNLNSKRIKLDEKEPAENELNGSVSKSKEGDSQSASETNCKGGSEKYDPENPESENEKESEVGDQQLKLNHSVKETKVVLEDIKKEVRVEEPPKIKEEPITVPVKLDRKPPGRSPAGGRGPRARRGRR